MGRLIEGFETLEIDGRELGREILGLETLGRGTFGLEKPGFGPLERPIDGREIFGAEPR